MINKPQQLQLERVRLASFNNLDGEKVADGLLKHRHLWDAFVFGRFRYHVLIELRDMSQDHLNADTLMVLTDLPRAKEIMALAEREWEVNETGYSGWVDGKFIKDGCDPCHNEKELWQDMGGLEDGMVVVRLWWD